MILPGRVPEAYIYIHDPQMSVPSKPARHLSNKNTYQRGRVLAWGLSVLAKGFLIIVRHLSKLYHGADSRMSDKHDTGLWCFQG